MQARRGLLGLHGKVDRTDGPKYRPLGRKTQVIGTPNAMSTQANAAGKAQVRSTESGVTTGGQKPDTVRDTIESIVVAFILAFVFRAFVVEAFVIPTGSMAPSLYGQHVQHRCPVCQYPFAYGIRERSRVGDRDYPGTLDNPFYVRCPNCTWDYNGVDVINTKKERVTSSAGDRILVLKWPYDIGGDYLGPQRWDVVVFKDPQDGETNFIKRLLGLPGEVLEIIDGDVYTAPVADVPASILEKLNKSPVTDAAGRRLSADESRALAAKLRIQRKTPTAQSSLWMIHYDHDFVPNQSIKPSYTGYYQPPSWSERSRQDAAAWDATRPIVTFRPQDGEEHWLELGGKPILDDCGYNNVSYNKSRHVARSFNVGDVRLRFVLLPGEDKGESELTLRLTKGRDDFRARIRSSGDVLLEKAGQQGIAKPMGRGAAKVSALRPGEAREIELEIVDYRVTLRIDGDVILVTTDDQYAPDINRLLQAPYSDGRDSRASVAISAKGSPLEIRHLQVHRDVFYQSVALHTNGNQPAVSRGWGTANNPILLRPDPPDYFCCGDNSPASKDSRMWVDVCRNLQERGDYQYGTVPGDQMIGRAFFVYWPSGLRFSKETPAVIPNVGRMRIIR